MRRPHATFPGSHQRIWTSQEHVCPNCGYRGQMVNIPLGPAMSREEEERIEREWEEEQRGDYDDDDYDDDDDDYD